MLVSKNELITQVQHLINMDRVEIMGYIRRNYPDHVYIRMENDLIAHLDRDYLQDIFTKIGDAHDFFLRYDVGAAPLLEYLMATKVSSFRQTPSMGRPDHMEEISKGEKTLKEMGFGPQHLHRKNSRDFTKKKVEP